MIDLANMLPQNPAQPAGSGAGSAVIRAAALLRNNDCHNFISELISISELN